MDNRQDLTSPVRDYGKNWEHSSTDVDDDAARRHQAMYIGLRLPKRPRRPHRTSRKSREKKHQSEAGLVTESSAVTDTGLSPSEIVQELLGDEHDEVQSHSIFCQMDILASVGGDMEWQEAARWVKYEEDVDEGGERWSKPHVASLSLHALFELRSCLTSACIMLDTDALTITQVVELLLDNLISSKLLEDGFREIIRGIILSPHHYQHQKRRRVSAKPDERSPPILPVIKSISDFGKRFSEHHHHSAKSRAEMQPFVENLRYNRSVPNMEHMNGSLPENASSAKLNQQFMRKIPEGAEAANILVGELETLTYQVCAFVRLSEGRILGDITEVPIPSRFIFILLGPTSAHAKNFEIGRSISTIMVDQVFREVAYRARNRQDILAGIDEFLDQVTVLPPGEWDPSIRIEPPLQVPSQEARKHVKPSTTWDVVIEVGEISHADPSLQRSGRLFGGLISDIKRKLPTYLSDFKDSVHVQCFASFIFLFLVTLTPNVTFGGVLGEATDNYMGAMECILSAAITGVLFALFSGQPLNILGSTGPMLVLEMILYHFCHDYDLDYMPLRFWIGAWTTAILLIIVAFDLSALVRYITRFTEESFACLIALIFILQAFKKLVDIVHEYPFYTDYDGPVPRILNCTCFPPPATLHLFNDSNGNWSDETGYSYSNYTMLDYDNSYDDVTGNVSIADIHAIEWSNLGRKECLSLDGELRGPECDVRETSPDVFFFSCLLFLGTFAVAMSLKAFKTSHFFPTFIRQTVSDFSVLIAIIIMVGLDTAFGISTPKLSVPAEFKPTRPGRGWFINPISDKNPWWLILAAIIPALLATILVFMDQQITAVIVNRKENKLKKGSGYHLDLFVVAICIFICSILGLPWFVAATVSALAHIMSLKKESECNAPGEHPTFLGVREQRVTALFVGILSGCCVLFTGVLRVIPLPVLYGVFFYMGIVALNGMQLVDRILIMMMPQKYQPDSMYLRHVRLKRVHIFTGIQVVCLAILYVIKTIKSVSIIFPLMVVGTCFVRKALDWVFTQRELKWLDDIMPDASKREKEDAKKKKDDDHKIEEVDDHHGNENIETNKLAQQKHSLMAYDRVNISEEMSKTGIWMQLRRNPSVPKFEDDDDDEHTPLHNGDHGSHRKKKRRRHKNNNNDDHKDEVPSGGGDVETSSPEMNHRAATFFIDEESDLIGIPEEETELDDDTKC